MPRAKVSKKAQAAKNLEVKEESVVANENGIENLKKSRAKKEVPVATPEPPIEIEKPKGRGSKKTKSEIKVPAEADAEKMIKQQPKVTAKEKPTKKKAQREEVIANGEQLNEVVEEPKAKAERGGRKAKASSEEKVSVQKNKIAEAAEEVVPKKSRSGREKKTDSEKLQNGDLQDAPIPNSVDKMVAQEKVTRKRKPIASQSDGAAGPSPSISKAKNEKPKAAHKRGRAKPQEGTAQQEQQEPPIEETPKKKTKTEKPAPARNGKAPRSKKSDEQNGMIDIDEGSEKATIEKTKTATNKNVAAAPKHSTERKRAANKLQSVEVNDQDEEDGVKPSKSKKPLLNPTESSYNKSDFELSPSIVVDGNSSNVSTNGTEYQRSVLKVSSWNVAGLRSWVKKDGLKFLEYEEPDIFCLQEIKCTTEQLPEEAARIPGYHPYWLCLPGGYAGVALYSKTMPINVEYGIGNEEFDSVGRLITAEYEKFYLINVYVPNSGRKLVNLEARMRWEKLFQAHVKKYDALKPVIICGDMNVSHQEIDLANPKSNTRSAGFTIEEREKMTELLSFGYVDTFRHLYPDKRGVYTYWTYMANARARNVGWRLDYFIVSDRILKRVIENAIRTQCLGSDHCPITLFINI